MFESIRLDFIFSLDFPSTNDLLKATLESLAFDFTFRARFLSNMYLKCELIFAIIPYGGFLLL